jgi:hypothetical protein
MNLLYKGVNQNNRGVLEFTIVRRIWRSDVHTVQVQLRQLPQSPQRYKDVIGENVWASST